MSAPVRLPLLDERGRGSLRSDGSRVNLVPADVRGRFARARRLVFAALIVFGVALPLVRFGGHPAMLLDVQRRQFFLFGQTFNAQDTWLVFFLLSGVGFVLIVAAAVLGRVWCGWACPQTVFLEGVFRRIERWIEGPRNAHLRRDAGPMTFAKVWRKAVKHALFFMLALALAHLVLAYFVSLPGAWTLVNGPPAQHLEAFFWTSGITLALYLDFAWFREQLCLIICPYGRLQAVLSDADTVTIGYDSKRGEPRGKVSDPHAGACVDCNRCVVVCPTGIDIRNGQQLDCIGCTACVDACDDVMVKLERPRGLVRHDSLNGLLGNATRFLRPRIFFYTFMLLAGVLAVSLALASHEPFEVNLLRFIGMPYVLDTTPQGVAIVRNGFELHIVNKQSDARTFTLRPVSPAGVAMQYVLPTRSIELDRFAERRLPLVVTLPESAYHEGLLVKVEVTMQGASTETLRVEALFSGP